MYIDSPNISGSLSITGSILLNGTAVTASGGGGGSGAGFPFSGSAVITGSLYVSGGNLSGSFAGDGSGLTNVTTTIDQFATVNDTFTNVPSHSVVHNFGTKDVFVQVFESDDTLLIPQTVTTTNTNQVDIVFGDVLSGRVVIGRAGHVLQDTGNFTSSSTAVQTFTNVTTASINHYLDSFNVITQVFDSNNNVIVPSNIKVATKDRVNLTFASSRSGKAVVAKAGHIVQGTSENAVSASFSDVSKRVRAGSSGSRPTTAESGSLWYNINTGNLEIYNGISGSGWDPITTTGIEFTPYTMEYFIAAGGGGAGTRHSGGGGGGGYKTGSISISEDTIYTIAVGAGGAGGSLPTIGNNNPGEQGIDSSISYTSTITALGGGGSGCYDDSGGSNHPGTSGGSGAGAGYTVSATAGTTGQGFDGGNLSSNVMGGGGGGATAVGSNASSTVGGNGGTGILSKLDGNNYYYCGGGGGSCWAQSSAGNGGTGGGGGGGSATSSGTAPTAGTGDTSGRNNGQNGNSTSGGGNAQGGNGGANTGGGGGGAGQGTYTNQPGYAYAGANGGSGIAIIKVPTSGYNTATTTGSPTVTTDGTDTILTYTQSGTYTA